MHCRVVKLVRSGTKQPSLLLASAIDKARPNRPYKFHPPFFEPVMHTQAGFLKLALRNLKHAILTRYF